MRESSASVVHTCDIYESIYFSTGYCLKTLNLFVSFIK